MSGGLFVWYVIIKINIVRSEGHAKGVCSFLSKSFDRENLLQTVTCDNIKIEKRKKHACSG